MMDREPFLCLPNKKYAVIKKINFPFLGKADIILFTEDFKGKAEITVEMNSLRDDLVYLIPVNLTEAKVRPTLSTFFPGHKLNPNPNVKKIIRKKDLRKS